VRPSGGCGRARLRDVRRRRTLVFTATVTFTTTRTPPLPPTCCSVKVRSVLLTPDDPAAALNVDGEVLPGPGPFTVHLLPSLLTMYGEY
jgi:hypothetical protein